MRLAVLSDIHDPIPQLRAALRERSAAGDHDLVCFGHTHEWELDRRGDTVALNPGEIMGRLGPPTFAVYDTGDGQVERHQLAP